MPDRQHAPDLLGTLKDAVAFHQRGELARAESEYLRVLVAKPGHGQTQRLLGILRHQQGRHAEALGWIDGALNSNPDDAEAHGNRGNVLLALGRAEEAVASYNRAIALVPTPRTPATTGAAPSWN